MTSSTDLPARSALQGSNAGGADAFVAKLDARGRRLRVPDPPRRQRRGRRVGDRRQRRRRRLAHRPHAVRRTSRSRAAAGRGGGAFATRLGASGAACPSRRRSAARPAPAWASTSTGSVGLPSRAAADPATTARPSSPRSRSPDRALRRQLVPSRPRRRCRAGCCGSRAGHARSAAPAAADSVARRVARVADDAGS